MSVNLSLILPNDCLDINDSINWRDFQFPQDNGTI